MAILTGIGELDVDVEKSLCEWCEWCDVATIYYYHIYRLDLTQKSPAEQ